MMRASLLLLLLLSGLPQDPDATPVLLKWKLAKDEFARFKVSGFDPATLDSLFESRTRIAGLFGYEIQNETRYAPQPFEDHAAPLSLAWTLPSQALSVGQSVPFSVDFDHLYYGALTVKGTITRQKSVTIDGASCVELVHKGTISPKPTAGDAFNAKGGTFEATVDFDAALGIARRTRISWSLTITGGGLPGDLQKPPLNEVLDYVKTLRLRGPEFEGEVNRAVDAGIQALRARFNEAEGHWEKFEAGPATHHVAYSALALLAILKGTLDRQDPRLQKALDWILAQPIERTYDTGIALLALEAWYSPHDPVSRFKGETVVATDLRQKIDKPHLEWAEKAVKFLERTQTQSGRWSYPYAYAPDEANLGDYSNTQYGVLGLFAASNLGVAVDPRGVHKILQTYLKSQEKTGPAVNLTRTSQSRDKKRGTRSTGAAERALARGFGYRDECVATTGPYGSMTISGIASLTILDSLLRRMRYGPYAAADQAKVYAAQRDAWAWMQTCWSVRANATTIGSQRDAGGIWYSYYLYTMERAGMLTGLATVGSHDWYWEGAEILVSNQLSDGNWLSTQVDTSFCVLFLKRATYYVPTPTGR